MQCLASFLHNRSMEPMLLYTIIAKVIVFLMLMAEDSSANNRNNQTGRAQGISFAIIPGLIVHFFRYLQFHGI